MAKLDWLENNDYGERQTRKEYLLAALFLWGLALVILLVPVRSSAQNIYYINAAEDTPTITGHVVQLEPTMQRRKGLTGVKGGSYRAKIDIEYNGTPYYVTNVGFNFTRAMYEQALDSGEVPVYLNPQRPEKSVLSKGVPFMQYFLPGVFAALGIFLLGAGVYYLKRSRSS